MKKLLLLSLALIATNVAWSEIIVTDFIGREVKLQKPAQRVVALAPHIVENMFTAGAGDRLVGAVDYSDYPEAAKAIPRIGLSNSFSLEAIVALAPDLVVTWHSGRGTLALEKLASVGITVYASNPKTLDDIPKAIRDYGALTGNDQTANAAATSYEIKLSGLAARYQTTETINVLYQIWNNPIQTINSKHIISHVIQLCGGINAFGESPALAPKLSIESVIAENPDVIIASGMGEEQPEWLQAWEPWRTINAVKNKSLYFIPPDIIQRHTVRLLDGASQMCGHLEHARQQISKNY
ncbi:cobalamin-binding protein [Aurantivibrio plasticivorans]